MSTEFNTIEKNVLTLWSTPLYVSSVPGCNLFVSDVNNSTWERTSNNDGYVTKETFLLDKPQFRNLKKDIEKHINLFVSEIAQFKNVDFYITNSWAVKHNKGDSATKHFHSNCIFSGIVYLQCNNNSGEIIFHKNPRHNTLHPESFLFDINEFNNFNSATQAILPQQEQILLFPSHIEHSVTASNSDKERIAIAFNTFFKGKIGTVTKDLSALEIK